MPIFRVNGKFLLFCHVPKCGGTAITHYLRTRFGLVAFVDERFPVVRDPWTKTSPQHISSDDLRNLFPDSFFDAIFAVVRHPLERIVSEYCYLRDARQLAPQSQTFSEWLAVTLNSYHKNRYALDNHLRPMSEIVPPGADVFKFEDGFRDIVHYLDRISGNQSEPRIIEPRHQRRKNAVNPEITREDVALIEKFFSRDYDRFSYPRSADHR